VNFQTWLGGGREGIETLPPQAKKDRAVGSAQRIWLLRLGAPLLLLGMAARATLELVHDSLRLMDRVELTGQG